MPTDSDKAAIVEAAQQRAAEIEQELIDAENALRAKREAAAQAQADAEATHAEVYAEEIAAQAATAQANHDRAFEQAAATARELAKKPTGPIDPDSIMTITIDGFGHAVVEYASLDAGHHGLTGDPSKNAARAATRFRVACGLAVDTPNDELVHARFATTAIDCTACSAALVAPEPAVQLFNTPKPPITEAPPE